MTTNLRAKRAAVVLYALVIVGLMAYANFVLVPLVEEGGQLARLEHRGFSGACFATARRATWVLPAALAAVLVLVYFISRGRVDQRLTALSVWLVLANALILGFYIVAFWWYYEGALLEVMDGR